jgi:hypothetical protein
MTFSDSDVEFDWPGLDELKQWRDVTGEEWDGDDGTRFTRELAAAVAIVKLDVGDWDELTDLPDAALGEAAMRMAVLLRANAGESTAILRDDPQYQASLKGHRRRFAIA